jgi:hypothetical protein
MKKAENEIKNEIQHFLYYYYNLVIERDKIRIKLELKSNYDFSLNLLQFKSFSHKNFGEDLKEYLLYTIPYISNIILINNYLNIRITDEYMINFFNIINDGKR